MVEWGSGGGSMWLLVFFLGGSCLGVHGGGMVDGCAHISHVVVVGEIEIEEDRKEKDGRREKNEFFFLIFFYFNYFIKYFILFYWVVCKNKNWMLGGLLNELVK